MKKVFTLACCLISVAVFAQQNYWQQSVHYTIDVSLNDKEKTLDGFEKITYRNQSPDTLRYIWFHLWPNAYKNDRTAFSDQLLQNGNTKFYFSEKEQKGYINRLDFKINGTTAKTEDHPQYIDVIKVLLPTPLAPQQEATITTPFHVKLPFNFSRGGYDGQSFQLTQWYPKPAVYDKEGWHPMPYLDQGEFYSEFGSFDVRITVPQTYVVAATGELQDSAELDWMKTKAAPGPLPKKSPAAKTTKKPASTASKNKITPPVSSRPVATKTLHYKQDKIHDFAWFVNKRFLVNNDTCRLPSGKIISVFTYYTPESKATWKNSLQYAKDAVRFFSTEVGEYPYPVVSVVEGPQSFGGGMEYPTITIISPPSSTEELDVTIAHEIGHNWFYGILASNERAHPWMDEGINTFYERKYSREKYGPESTEEEVFFQTTVARKTDQPIETSAEAFNALNYGLVAYHKTARWMQWMENKMGKDAFRRMMQAYFEQWKFKHPQPEDFKAVASSSLGNEASEVFHLLTTKGRLPGTGAGGIQLVTLFKKQLLKDYLDEPSASKVLLSPAAGINNYDKLMVGGLITNYQLPPSKFQFFVAPLYSFNAKKLNGAGVVNYTAITEGKIQKIRLGLSALNFSKNLYLDSNGQKVFERFFKISPSIQVRFREGVQSTRERQLEARTFIIDERNFDTYTMKSTDSLFYVDSIKKSSRLISQLTYSVSNFRALYPYHHELQLQYGEGFYRVNATANYFFNYAKGGGLNVRLFAAKFGITDESKKSSAFIYQPKLLGVTGVEDYTYSNYFLGRTATLSSMGSVVKNDGIGAQQIMIRDGGLKLRMDQFEYLQGRSENWVAALNFNTTLPEKLFPIKLPLKLFFDMGTFSEAWDSKYESSRLLYVGGLQVSLFKNLFNIYMPLIYSSEFRDAFQTIPEQNTFFKRLTFSIDIQNFSLRRITDNKIAL